MYLSAWTVGAIDVNEGSVLRFISHHQCGNISHQKLGILRHEVWVLTSAAFYGPLEVPSNPNDSMGNLCLTCLGATSWKRAPVETKSFVLCFQDPLALSEFKKEVQGRL